VALRERTTMKLRVNAELCQGHGRCYALAPELFDLDDIGHALPLDVEIDATNKERANLARLNCPEGAISLRK
jgi:ferredoxin